tara:strand:+ start:23206 stop:23358 length:153 start_codon:yes stop_codon:yes gene_type:complete
MRKILCFLGFHKKETITISMINQADGEPMSLYYDVCKHCGDGHPLLTGEW